MTTSFCTDPFSPSPFSALDGQPLSSELHLFDSLLADSFVACDISSKHTRTAEAFSCKDDELATVKQAEKQVIHSGSFYFLKAK